MSPNIDIKMDKIKTFCTRWKVVELSLFGLAYLWDMLDAAKTVQGFIKGVKFHQYEKDRKLQLAVERAIEIIGEVARNVSKKFQHAHPEIPWRGIIGQRHMFAHEYGEIKQERMWLAVQSESLKNGLIEIGK